MSAKRGNGGILLDVILTLLTGGLWLIWIIIKVHARVRKYLGLVKVIK